MAARFSLVEAIILTSTSRSTVSPTLRMDLFSITLRSLACKSGEREFISSKYSVPPSATSKSPALSMAPVKLPFTEPNSVLSIKLSGMAAQFWIMKGFLFLGLLL